MKTFAEFVEQSQYMPAVQIWDSVQKAILPQLRPLKGLPIEKKIAAIDAILSFLGVKVSDLQHR